MPFSDLGKVPLNALLNFIYPPICGYCRSGLHAQEKLFCTKCWRSVRQVESATLDELTATRVRSNIPLQQIKTLWWFDDFVQTVIHEMKYKRKLSLAKKLGEELAKIVLQDEIYKDADLLIPVPLHKSKQRERGYNQSLLIAESIARETGIPVATKMIKRVQKTQTQAKLTAEQRMKNVGKAFETVSGDIENKEVILIDDVCTTGATLFACADALLTAGCSRILALTVAKALDLEQDSKT